MAVWIDNSFGEFVKQQVKQNWPEKKVKWFAPKGTWQSSRYVQIMTCIKDMDIHYEYLQGCLQLHFEGKFLGDEYKDFRRYIRECVPSDETYKWRQWAGMKQGLCELNLEINTWEELSEQLPVIIDKFDPIISSFVKDNPDMFETQKPAISTPNISYVIKETSESPTLKREIKSIAQIEFDRLVIPPYQRPYKWTAKNVNQLITDIIAFRNKRQYRLGTLVLHNNEIVDGQQRIVTLALLLTTMYHKIQDSKLKESYVDFYKKLCKFSVNTNFPNRYSLHNVVENLHVIEARENDFNDELFDFILQKCEFVVIELSDISEAFQFFDSQNARGKDLEAHDLLKAYHLREIQELKESDSNNIDFWQSQKTDYLKDVFLTMFRAKRWAQGKSARYFTKNRVDTFKGISLRDGKRYPFYQMEVIAHIFSEFYLNDPIRIIDRQRMEYPFNLDDQIINGSRFFDMVRHYMRLYDSVRDIEFYPQGGKAEEIMSLVNNYAGMSRTGDKYIRNLFDTIILYYIDRFGKEELDKVIPKFFVWAYSLRLVSSAVQLASADGYALDSESLLRAVHYAKTPYDIINVNLEGLTQGDIKCSKCEEVIMMFKKLNKIYNA